MTGLGENDLATNEPVPTVTPIAMAAALVMPCAVVMLLAAIVTLNPPLTGALGVAAITSKIILQLPLAGMAPPVRVPEVAVTLKVPPQVVERLLGDANANCTGNVKVVDVFVDQVRLNV